MPLRCSWCLFCKFCIASHPFLEWNWRYSYRAFRAALLNTFCCDRTTTITRLTLLKSTFLILTINLCLLWCLGILPYNFPRHFTVTSFSNSFAIVQVLFGWVICSCDFLHIFQIFLYFDQISLTHQNIAHLSRWLFSIVPAGNGCHGDRNSGVSIRKVTNVGFECRSIIVAFFSFQKVS